MRGTTNKYNDKESGQKMKYSNSSTVRRCALSTEPPGGATSRSMEVETWRSDWTTSTMVPDQSDPLGDVMKQEPPEDNGERGSGFLLREGAWFVEDASHGLDPAGVSRKPKEAGILLGSQC